MNLTEKTAYLKGLADGLNYNKETAEGKLIAALIDLVDEMAKDISVLDEAVEELNDYIEEIDEDLGDVEEYLMDEEDEYDDCDCDCCDCCDCDCARLCMISRKYPTNWSLLTALPYTKVRGASSLQLSYPCMKHPICS